MSTQPLVSCIMPTYNRRRFVPLAIEYFLRQDYRNRELLILDDGDDCVRDLVPHDERIRYVRLAQRLTLGEKRNQACRQARGEIIMHWDDDDWSSAKRISRQVADLERSGAEVTGLAHLYFFDPLRPAAWEYQYAGARPWVAGGSLCYWRSFWERNPFPEITIGEDACFLWNRPGIRIHSTANVGFYAALIHPGNTSVKQTNDILYRVVELSQLKDCMGADWQQYQRLCIGNSDGAAESNRQPVFSLCYTTRRPACVSRVAEIWRDRAADRPQIELVIAVDGDDPASLEAARCVPDARIVTQADPPYNCVRGWNAAAGHASGAVLVAVSDDIEPPENWDRKLLGFRPGWIGGEAVFNTGDGLYGTRCHLAIMTRRRYQRLGYLFYPDYESMYCDTDMAEHAIHDGVFLDASAELCFRHWHPQNLGRPQDRIDQIHSARERYVRGEALLQRRRQTRFATQPGAGKRTKLEGLPAADRYGAYVQTIRDDFCLKEVLERLYEEGVRDFFLCIPDQQWSGVPVTAAQRAQVEAAADYLRRFGNAQVYLQMFPLGPHRAPGRSRAAIETLARNEQLAWVRSHGIRHCLVVDDDEFWRRGLLARLDQLVKAQRPTSVACRMTPVAGVPGYPIADNMDMVTIYMDLERCCFRECRSPEGTTQRLDWNGVIHFTAVKRTREDLLAKLRESGHYDDPHYDFEGWIARTLPEIRPGFRNVHMYRPVQIWPTVREWFEDEISEIPATLRPYLGTR